MNQWGEEENCGMDDGGCPRCCLCTANDDDYDDDESLFNSTEPNSQRHVMLMAIDLAMILAHGGGVAAGGSGNGGRQTDANRFWRTPVQTLRTPTNKTADNTIVLRVVLYRTSDSIVL
eukprot:scaffold1512_cov192-Alexandrium_tamarense.AAC.30